MFYSIILQSMNASEQELRAQDYQQHRKPETLATDSSETVGQKKPATSIPVHAQELLRRSFLGEELVDVLFHLYSAKSTVAGRVVKPRVLCANSVLLAKSSKYFSDRKWIF